MDKTIKDPQKYHGIKYRIFFAGLLLDVVLLLGLLFSRVTFGLKEAAYSAAGGQVVWGNALFVAGLGSVSYLIHAPLNYFEGFVWEHKFGLSNQTFLAWLKDDLKKSVLGLVLSVVLVCVIYWFLGRMEHGWWLAAGCFWLLLSFVLAKLTPNVIVPLFYKYKEISNEPLKQRIRQMFTDCKTTLKDIYAIDFSSKTKKANAFICGLGQSRRVVLSDTLLSEFADEEIEAVVAHELGHYRHRDILKLLVVNAAVTFSGLYLIDKILNSAGGYFGFNGIDDIASLPLFILVFSMFGMLLSPLLNWYSCRLEKAADRFSLQMTGKPNVFIAMMNKLGALNLAEFQPNRFIEIFFYDHPPIQKRIEFAREFNNRIQP